MTQREVVAGDDEPADLSCLLRHRNKVQFVPRVIQSHLRAGMITDRDHEVFFDLGCLAFDSAMSSAGRIALAECLNQATSELVLLDEMVCQEGVGLVRVFMAVEKRNR